MCWALWKKKVVMVQAATSVKLPDSTYTIQSSLWTPSQYFPLNRGETPIWWSLRTIVWSPLLCINRTQCQITQRSETCAITLIYERGDDKRPCLLFSLIWPVTSSNKPFPVCAFFFWLFFFLERHRPLHLFYTAWEESNISRLNV